MNKSRIAFAIGVLIYCLSVLISASAQIRTPGAAGDPYPNMPLIATLGERIDKHITVNESAKGPSIDPSKGYRIQELGWGLYMITDNAYQSMFMVHETGVVVVDAPQPLEQYLLKAIAEITTKPITHLVYSHAHADHISATNS